MATWADLSMYSQHKYPKNDVRMPVQAEDTRLTRWLSSMSLPDMYFTSFDGLLTTFLSFSQKPEYCIVAPKIESTILPMKPATEPKTMIGHWGGYSSGKPSMKLNRYKVA